MSDHPNAARYREMTAAMQTGEMEGFADALADDIEWYEIGSTEPVRGKQAMMETMQSWGDYEITPVLHDVVANDDHLIALLGVTARKGDETFEYRTAEIMHVNADGQVTQRWAFSDDTAAIVAFFS